MDGGSARISRTCAEQGPQEVLCSSSIKSMPFPLVAVKLIIMPIFLSNGRVQGPSSLPATPKAKPHLDRIVGGAKLVKQEKNPNYDGGSFLLRQLSSTYSTADLGRRWFA